MLLDGLHPYTACPMSNKTGETAASSIDSVDHVDHVQLSYDQSQKGIYYVTKYCCSDGPEYLSIVYKWHETIIQYNGNVVCDVCDYMYVHVFVCMCVCI